MGPVGLGVVAQIFNFTNLIANSINLGLPVGLSSKIPALSKDDSEISKAKIRSYIEYFLVISSVISITVIILFILFSDVVLDFLIGNTEYKTVYLVMIFSIPFLVSYSIIESVLRGLAKINVIVKITIASSLVSIIFLFPLIYFINIEGVAIYLLLFSTLPLVIFIVKYRSSFVKYLSTAKTKILKSEKSAIYKIGTVSVVSTLLHQGCMILLRRMIISNLGLENNGIYQSVLAISANTFSIVYIFLTNYTLPKLSELNEKKEINSEINNNLRLLILILIPAVVIVFTYREYIILILFSKSFLEASDLLVFQLTGDIFRAFAALFGLWMIPKMKIKQIIIIDIVFNVIFISLPFLFVIILKYDLSIIPLCYMMAFFVHFILYFIYSKKEISFTFSKIVSRNLFYSVIILVSAFFLSTYYTDSSLFLNLIFLSVWAYFIVDREEKEKILNYLRMRK